MRNMHSSTAPALPPTIRWYMPVVLLLAALAFAAVWAFFAVSLQKNISFVAVLAALDIAWFIRKMRWPFRDSRPMIAMAFTALSIGAANWWMAKLLFGHAQSLNLFRALQQTSVDNTVLAIRTINAPVDWFWYAFAIFLAAILASRRDHRAP